MDPVRRIQAEASQYSLGFHASSRLILNEEEEDFDKLYFHNNTVVQLVSKLFVAFCFLAGFILKECSSSTSINTNEVTFHIMAHMET